MKGKLPPTYQRDAEALALAFREWIELQATTRSVDLRWHDWGGVVCFAGPLAGEALDMLCDSPDARAMCEWSDERTGHRCTLLMAMAAAETLGLKTPGKGTPPPIGQLARSGVLWSVPGADRL